MFYGEDPTSNSDLDQQLRGHDMMLGVLKEHLRLAQEKMKKSVDKKRRDVEFQVGDWVFLKLRPYRQNTLRNRRNEKLSPKFFGPYLVVEHIGSLAYKLKLPLESAIHPLFHVA